MIAKSERFFNKSIARRFAAAAAWLSQAHALQQCGSASRAQTVCGGSAVHWLKSGTGKSGRLAADR